MCLPAGVFGRRDESLTMRTAKSIRRSSSSSARNRDGSLLISLFSTRSTEAINPQTSLKSMTNEKCQMINEKCSRFHLHFLHHAPGAPKKESAQQAERDGGVPDGGPTATPQKRVTNHFQVVTHRH